MAMIFRQPGKTGMKILKNVSLSVEHTNNINKTVRNRNKYMKLNSIIFCLCAGLCSSTMIENAFSIGNNKETWNNACKLDSYRVMIVSKYFDNLRDFANLAMTAKKFKENIDKFHYNPVSITPEQLHLWSHLETLHLYTDDDIAAWINGAENIDNLHKIEVWASIKDVDVIGRINHLERLVAKSKNTSAKITFRNVTLTHPEIFGKFDENKGFKFNKDVYTNGDQKDANFVITSINGSAFQGSDITSISIPDSVNYIADGSFRWCSKLKSVVIPDSVTYIGHCSFLFCSSLAEVVIPDRVTSIGNWAFFACKDLSSLILGKSVSGIYDFAFDGCQMLTEVTIPDSVTSIGADVFKECKNIKLTVPYKGMAKYFSLRHGINNVEIAEKSNFDNEWAWANDGNIIIPNNVTSISDEMFLKRLDINSIIIPDSVNSIGSSVFEGCENLNKLSIGKGVVTLHSGVFGTCFSLTEITIHDSISIDIGAFLGCVSLQEIKVKCTRECDKDIIIKKISYGFGNNESGYIPVDITVRFIDENDNEIEVYKNGKLG